MRCFGCMDEVGWGACTGQRGRKLATDMPGLADTADDDPPVPIQNQLDGCYELTVQALCKRFDCVASMRSTLRASSRQ